MTSLIRTGMGLVCSAPRLNSTGTVGGCQSNDGSVFNECLWQLTVPRPGGLGWPEGSRVCVNDTAAAPPSPRPPAPKANPGQRAPPLAPFPPSPPSPCLMAGASTESLGPATAGCGLQVGARRRCGLPRVLEASLQPR
jgi:hypothetical protein